jgi:hypothetical protein
VRSVDKGDAKVLDVHSIVLIEPVGTSYLLAAWGAILVS